MTTQHTHLIVDQDIANEFDHRIFAREITEGEDAGYYLICHESDGAPIRNLQRANGLTIWLDDGTEAGRDHPDGILLTLEQVQELGIEIEA